MICVLCNMKYIYFCLCSFNRKTGSQHQLAAFSTDPVYQPFGSGMSLTSAISSQDVNAQPDMSAFTMQPNPQVGQGSSFLRVVGTQPLSSSSMGSLPTDLNLQPPMIPTKIASPNPCRAITGGIAVNQPIDPLNILRPSNTPPVSSTVVQSGLVQYRRNQWEQIQTKEFQGTTKQALKQPQQNVRLTKSDPGKSSKKLSQKPTGKASSLSSDEKEKTTFASSSHKSVQKGTSSSLKQKCPNRYSFIDGSAENILCKQFGKISPET